MFGRGNMKKPSKKPRICRFERSLLDFMENHFNAFWDDGVREVKIVLHGEGHFGVEIKRPILPKRKPATKEGAE